MHFALPPKKSSFAPPYARASVKNAIPQRRRRQLQTIGFGVLAILTVFLVVRWIGSAAAFNDDDDGSIPEDSSIMIVTVINESDLSEDFITMIKANRDDYAARHGYKTFYANESTYDHLIKTSPPSWSLVPALRHTLSLHPEIDYIWSLSPYALITNITISLHKHILGPLPSLMLKDIAVVPPDSVIHTFSNVRPSEANLIISQDIDNLAHTSFILRNTQARPTSPNHPRNTWTQYFLDAWFDPLYRSYAFQKAENHALEHIVQWHPTILAKIAIISQRRINSYNYQTPEVTDEKSQKTRWVDSMWKPGDLIVNFKGCAQAQERECEREMRRYFNGWMREVEFFDGKKPVVNLKAKDYVSKTHEGGDKDREKKHADEPRVHI